MNAYDTRETLTMMIESQPLCDALDIDDRGWSLKADSLPTV